MRWLVSRTRSRFRRPCCAASSSFGEAAARIQARRFCLLGEVPSRRGAGRFSRLSQFQPCGDHILPGCEVGRCFLRHCGDSLCQENGVILGHLPTQGSNALENSLGDTPYGAHKRSSTGVPLNSSRSLASSHGVSPSSVSASTSAPMSSSSDATSGLPFHPAA